MIRAAMKGNVAGWVGGTVAVVGILLGLWSRIGSVERSSTDLERQVADIRGVVITQHREAAALKAEVSYLRATVDHLGAEVAAMRKQGR